MGSTWSSPTKSLYTEAWIEKDSAFWASRILHVCAIFYIGRNRALTPIPWDTNWLCQDFCGLSQRKSCLAISWGRRPLAPVFFQQSFSKLMLVEYLLCVSHYAKHLQASYFPHSKIELMKTKWLHNLPKVTWPSPCRSSFLNLRPFTARQCCGGNISHGLLRRNIFNPNHRVLPGGGVPARAN